MGGAQPLAITMNEGVGIIVEVEPARIKRRHDIGYVDTVAKNLDDAIAMARQAMAEGKPLSIALEGNASDIHPELVKRGIMPDVVTDQTSAHDPLNGYVPGGMKLKKPLF